LGLYKQKEDYWDFSSIVSVLEKKMLEMTPIGNFLEEKKRGAKHDQNAGKIEEKLPKIKKEIDNIITFIMMKPLATQNLLLNMMREKLKTYQN
jgi:hypothetical protein